jgi:predicted transcriptional regulator of viral defense system
MKHKTISYRSSELLKSLLDKNKSFFTILEASKILGMENSSTIRELLRSMNERGLILRIKEGLYHVIPYEKESESYFPNWHLTAEALVGKKEYYLGFYTALDIQGLITQPSLVEQIVVKDRVAPKNYKIKEVRFETITFNNEHFFGYEKTWIDDFNKVNCSDLEKTIIDCLYKPNYANGIPEIIKAIYRGREKINSDKVIKYLEKFNAQVVYKRLGFILKQLDILQAITDEIRFKLSNAYTLLNPSLPKEGKHYSEWRIIDNIDIKSALKSLKT